MIKLSNRLKACADMVSKGAKLCDVGTDHGYVPVYLTLNDTIVSAVACDINKAPLDSCKSLVSEYNLGDKIKCVLSDGLKEIDKNDIDEILIAGMGGELISKILTECDYIKDKRLILNPMTHPEIAREWLYSNGFEIICDIIVCDGRHHYNIMSAEYTGEICEKTQTDYFFGNIKDFSDKEYFRHLLTFLENKQKGGSDYSAVISSIKEIL